MAILNTLDVADKATSAAVKQGTAVTDTNELGTSKTVADRNQPNPANPTVAGSAPNSKLTTRFDDPTYYG